MCSSGCFSTRGCAPQACIQASGDLRGPSDVFTQLFLKMRVYTKCLHTSIWGICKGRSMCSSSCFSRSGCAPHACIQASGRFSWTVVCVHEHSSQDTVHAPDACIQTSGRFLWTILCVHKAVCEYTVVQQMLVYKRLGA